MGLVQGRRTRMAFLAGSLLRSLLTSALMVFVLHMSAPLCFGFMDEHCCIRYTKELYTCNTPFLHSQVWILLLKATLNFWMVLLGGRYQA